MNENHVPISTAGIEFLRYFELKDEEGAENATGGDHEDDDTFLESHLVCRSKEAGIAEIGV
jgi:hypothetical protein